MTLKRQTYRVYEAAVGSDLVFCGELDDLRDAMKFANSEPAGLPKSLWDTARVAGHVGGLLAPDLRGDEADEVCSWHGKKQNHCICVVRYR